MTKTLGDVYDDLARGLDPSPTGDELLRDLGYEKMSNDKEVIRFENHSHGDGCYSYVIFYPTIKSYVVGFYDGYREMTFMPFRVEIALHEAIMKKFNELVVD